MHRCSNLDLSIMRTQLQWTEEDEIVEALTKQQAIGIYTYLTTFTNSVITVII